ncbi:MAG: PilZ domain-containing protein [Proteobacteria bacterium]|nr:PilZ domain-containing protein [Pseudomonadota bacterium]
MSIDPNIFQIIANGKPVRIFLPLLDRQERARAQCICRDIHPPKFSLIFKSGVLPLDDLDTRQPCIISIDMGGPTISLEAMIQEISNPQTLQMILQKSISHEQMREFFRIDAVTRVISSSFHTQFVNQDSEPWAIQGETMDLSGSGILAIFPNPPPTEKQVQLEITIPSNEPETVKVIAHQVRMQQQKDGRYEVAYHFDDISDEDRDKIIGCCLVLQRKLLRLKVQILES